MNVDLVVFDIAGTTVHDPDGVNLCLSAALAAAGVHVSRDQINEVMGIPKPVAIQSLLASADDSGGEARITAIHADFVDRMVAFYETNPEVREVPGAVEAFQRLRAAGIRVALDTGFDRRTVTALLARLGWEEGDCIDATITSDEVSNGRPHPDLVLRLMERLEVTDARRVAKVGDTPSDLEEGMRAGCGWVIGVTNGSHRREQLVAYPHTHLVDSVADVPALLGL